MVDWGVTDSGFVKKLLEDIKTEIENDLKAAISPGLNLLATSVLGQQVGIFSDKLREEWDVSEAVYRSQYPDSATGEALDNVASITGVIREAAEETTVSIICTGDNATSLSVGRVVSSGSGDRFESTAAGTLATAAAWAATTSYELDDIVRNDTPDNIYVCVTAGISAGSGGPTGTGDGITDNTCVWNFVGDGAAYDNIPFQSEETGPISAAAGAINTEVGSGAIETPVSGWNDARNIRDGDPGQNTETDAELRVRREQLLRVTGAGSVEAIRADLLDTDGVEQAFVFENTSLITDSDGVPGKAFEAVVQTEENVDAGVAASFVNNSAETYDLDDGQTLLVKVDGTSAQTATFNTGDFSNIDNATAAEIATVITTDISGATASAVTVGGSTYVQITSNATDASSSIEVTGGTANAVLGFPASPVIANGIDTTLANVIWQSKPAGIQSWGQFFVIVEDSQNENHLIGLSNPEPKVVEVQATIEVDDDFPSNGSDQVKAALVAFISGLNIGGDVILDRLKAECYTVSGARDVTNFEVRFTGDGWGTSNLVITNRQIAILDTSDITLTVNTYSDLP